MGEKKRNGAQQAVARIAELRGMSERQRRAALRKEGRQYFAANAQGDCDACDKLDVPVLCDQGEQECIGCYAKRYAAVVAVSLAAEMGWDGKAVRL